MVKKTRSLNDTAAIQEMSPDGLNRHESKSESVRKISNGYIHSTSSSKDGLYESREEFSPTPPDLGGVKDGSDSMKRAVEYMKREGTL